jgi:drug/metabolite transporter (DMT)-like permease
VSPETAPSSTAKGILIMLLATLCFAAMDSMSKYLIASYSPIQILWVRFVCFVVFALAVTGGPKRLVTHLRARRPGLQVLRSALLVLEMIVFVLALRYLALADAHVLFASGPLVVTALSIPLLGEKVGLRRWAAILVGFLGIVIVLQPGGDLFQAAALIPLLATFMFAFYQVLTRLASRSDTTQTALLYQAIVGLLMLTLAVPFQWQPLALDDLGIMVVLGFSGAMAHYLLIKALQMAPASVLQPYMYSVLVWAIGTGYLFFGDIPGLVTLIGAAIIVASGLYTFHREALRQPKARKAEVSLRVGAQR